MSSLFAWTVGVRLRRGHSGWIQTRTEAICRGDEKSIANRIRRHQQNRDGSAEAPCTWIEQHLFTSGLQSFHHHDTHAFEKLVA